QPLSAVEVFIPELVEKCAEDEPKDEYRFLWTHAGQFKCKVTQLMFEMEGEGEVLYRIVSWDTGLLDGLGQKEPAGPLYSINCHKGSIRKLHLPHCETRKDDVKLTVAHVTGRNVEIIQPLQVTDTHVIIDVQGFSLFGLLRDLIFKDYPIEAQVLVFDMNLKGKHRKNKLHMHLLPGNVPAEEVKKFKCHYGPNYHPTFEVFFNTDVDEVTLDLLDENKKEVWSRLVLLTGSHHVVMLSHAVIAPPGPPRRHTGFSSGADFIHLIRKRSALSRC
ncbi:uncharacterized protein LOC128511934, partial [Clarias gariepinus]|uniref:uncharacterized protein LOC128511934 n=1 Tax=Clarias gariepinus TaxID=13013 RepID=UPI00234C3296